MVYIYGLGKTKAVKASNKNQGINSLFPTGRQVFSHLQESKVPSHVVLTWEEKCHNSKHHLFLFVHTDLRANYDAIIYDISLWSVEVNCASHASFLQMVQSQPFHCDNNLSSRKGLDAMEELLSRK